MDGGWLDGGGWMGWVWVDGDDSGWRGAPTHMHMPAHVRTCMHGKHDNFMQMATHIGGIPGNSL